jgi:hypothetical protein
MICAYSIFSRYSLIPTAVTAKDPKKDKIGDGFILPFSQVS